MIKKEFISYLMAYPDDMPVEILHHNGAYFEGKKPKIVNVNEHIQIL